MAVPDDIRAVLDRHLSSVPLPTDGSPVPSEQVERLLVLTGLTPQGGGHAERLVAAAITTARALGIPVEVLFPLAQAYSRGLGRIVAAESDHIRMLICRQPSDRQAEYVDRFLSRNLPLARELFQALHNVMLREALDDALSEESLDEPESPERVVALVDICGSTRYLGRVGRAQTQRLVDALYEAGQTATTGRAVWAVKYVGDGVFLVGRDAREVVEASLHGIEVLERELPLRARAGLASGPVVRRAGDYFGPVVNLAQRLTTAARPGTVLAEESATASLDGSLIAARDVIEVRGVDQPVAVAVVGG